MEARRIYRCKYCKKAFTTTSARSKHINKKHSDTLKFKCGKCKKGYNYLHYYDLHLQENEPCLEFTRKHNTVDLTATVTTEEGATSNATASVATTSTQTMPQEGTYTPPQEPVEPGPSRHSDENPEEPPELVPIEVENASPGGNKMSFFKFLMSHLSFLIHHPFTLYIFIFTPS